MPWGAVIGGVISAAGSYLGSSKAAKHDLTGYNYLSGPNGVQGYVSSGNQANSSANALLTGGPNSAAASSAYSNYLNSTGYNFQRQQGTAAITGTAASRGLLNSGGTAKSLARFGQGLAGESFKNYLGELGNVAARGLTASDQIGNAGNSGGQAAGQSSGSGIAGAAGQLGGAASAGYNNYFGSNSSGNSGGFSYQDPVNF